MASKKIILKESQYEQLMINSILTESTVDDILKSREFEKKIKDTIAAAIKNDKTIERKIREIVNKTISELFKVLWMRRDFYKDV
jgi:hypothetical protein